MKVPSKIMSIRHQIASELKSFAGLLEKADIGSPHQLYKAVSALQDDNQGLHSPGTTDYKCWGYQIEDVTISIPLPRRHMYPPSIYSMQVQIDSQVLCNAEDFGTMRDPFIIQNFRACITGVDLNNKYSFGFHIDRHINGDTNDEVHPLYHLHYSPITKENDEIGNVLALDSPRFIHLPIDFILGIDLVLANFYPEKWAELRNEAIYQSIFRKYQEVFWKPYLHTFASKWTFNNTNIVWDGLSQICPMLIN